MTSIPLFLRPSGSGGALLAQSRPYPMNGVEEPLEICEVGEEGKARLRQRLIAKRA
jgi:hypothetical protein